MNAEGMARSRAQRQARRTWMLAAATPIGIVAAWHIAITVLYLLPKNPISNSYATAVQSYMSPFFEQNWHLFSPNPVTRTERVIARCHLRTAGSSDWIDPSHAALVHHSRFLGVTGQSYVLRNFLGLSREIAEKMDARRAACGSDTSCLDMVARGLVHEETFAHVRRYVSKACRGWSKDSDRAEVQLASLAPRPFSKRKEAWVAPITRIPLGLIDFGGMQ